MKFNFIFYILLLLLFSFFSIATAKNLSVSTNLLQNKNCNVEGIRGYRGMQHHQYRKEVSHTVDGSGSIELVGHWYTKQFRTPSFKLEKGKHYILGAYIKALASKYGQNVMFKIGGVGEMSEMNWNISTVNHWEEILMPYRAKKTGLYYIAIFTHRYALSTNGKFVTKKGENLDKRAKVYLDDFFVYENEKIFSHNIKNMKKTFTSNVIHIDALGNWSVYEKGVWKAIFPKFAYQDWEDSHFRNYKKYGFTGIINIDTLEKFHNAVDQGLKYNGIQVNHLTGKIKKVMRDVKQEILHKKLPPYSLLLYNFDNESTHLSKLQEKTQELRWLKKYDQEHPIYMLNGVAEGVTRQYNNTIDVTGTYITATGNEIEKYENPVNSFELLSKIDHQKTPVSMMQLQCYYHHLFIPSIFKGLGEGAKSLTFWRGGKGLERYGCPKDFTKNVWASALKGKKGVFALIDRLLPILREPIKTKWSASVDTPSLVSIATRDHNSKHYLFLANFSRKTQQIHISLKGLSVSSVKNFFTKKYLFFNKKRENFSIFIDKYNKGYLVLELN